MYIGKKVRELRQAQGLKLKELAAKSGVQMATLSRIEHLKMPGTLECHYKIAKALGIDVVQLYAGMITEDQLNAQITQPASDVFVHNESASYEILCTRIFSRRMMPILLKIDPSGQTNKEQSPSGSEKFVFVLEGNVAIKVGAETYNLSRRHALYFDAGQEHQFINPDPSPAQVICVTTPVAL